MRIAVIKESRNNETRIAVSSETVKKLKALDFEIIIEKNAGMSSGISDEDFINVGAQIAQSPQETIQNADIILKVQTPTQEEINLFKEGQILISSLNPFKYKEEINNLTEKGVICFAMDFMPRISRAQSMDVLSSQSNLAGYKAVVDAASEFTKVFPLMMTSAGTVPAAKVLILGAGVAGLQAIATAKRLGAIVYAFDVRPAVKEQVESLGGRFVEVKANIDAETAGGYAKEMDEDYKRRQSEAIAEQIKKSDIVISTALIPGKPAPKLITEEMVKSMQAGSVIVDLAVEAGGNCALSECGKIVEKYNVKIMGHENLPARLSIAASALYAKNLYNFISTFVKDKKFQLDWDDELVKGSCIAKDKKIIHPLLAPLTP